MHVLVFYPLLYFYRNLLSVNNGVNAAPRRDPNELRDRAVGSSWSALLLTDRHVVTCQQIALPVNRSSYHTIHSLATHGRLSRATTAGYQANR